MDMDKLRHPYKILFKGTSKEQPLGTPGHRHQGKMIKGLRERQCESVNRN
jgi:hypothetical protein